MTHTSNVLCEEKDYQFTSTAAPHFFVSRTITIRLIPVSVNTNLKQQTQIEAIFVPFRSFSIHFYSL